MTREEAVIILNGFKNNPLFSDTHAQAFDMAISALENKGEWITDKERLGYWISTCSECGHIFHGNEVLIYKPKFCSNCGARMREG